MSGLDAPIVKDCSWQRNFAVQMASGKGGPLRPKSTPTHTLRNALEMEWSRAPDCV